jgi:hypothetical protein
MYPAPMTELRAGQSVALGITVDKENQVVILVCMSLDEDGDPYAVALSPEIARHFGRSARDLSREADKLQDELDDLDPEEIKDRLIAIQSRYLTGPPPPS